MLNRSQSTRRSCFAVGVNVWAVVCVGVAGRGFCSYQACFCVYCMYGGMRTPITGDLLSMLYIYTCIYFFSTRGGGFSLPSWFMCFNSIFEQPSSIRCCRLESFWYGARSLAVGGGGGCQGTPTIGLTYSVPFILMPHPCLSV